MSASTLPPARSPSNPVSAAPNSAFRADIQGLRALALFVIFIYHAGLPLHGGYVALDVFFVISGFVIIQMLMREHTRSGRIDLRSFFVRRFRRLTPALAVTVTVVMLVAVLLQSPFGAQQQTAWTGLGALVFASNAVIAANSGSYFDDPAARNPLLNLWSLSAEEQFYLVFPLLMVAGWWLARRLRRPVAPVVVLVILGTASLLLAIVTSRLELTWPATAVVGYYGAAGRAWEFAAGALLGWALAGRGALPRWVGEFLGWSGIALIAIAAFTYTSATPYPGVATLVPVIGAMALIAAGQARDASIPRFMAWRPMAYSGDLSYSWYLWHWPFAVFALILVPRHPIAAASVAIVLSVIPAYISYRFVERPIREGRAFRGRTGHLAAVTYAAPIIVGAAVLGGASQGWWLKWPVTYRYSDSLSYRCHDTAIDWELCSFGPSRETARGTVALIGDSQALSLSDGLVAAAGELGWRTLVSSRSECPVVPPGNLRWTYDNSGCERWQAEIVDSLIALAPDAVVIAQRPYFEGRTGNVDLIDDNGTVLEGDESVNAFASDLAGTVGQLRDAGIKVVLVDPIPEAAYDLPPQGLLGRREARIDVADARALAELPARVNTRLADDTGAVVVDPLDTLCGPTTCPEVVDGFSLYADARHLSPKGALKLQDSLAAALRQG